MALSLLVLLQIKPRVDGLPDSAVRLLRRERVLDLREVERELIGRDVATAAALVRAHEHVGERDLVELDPWPFTASLAQAEGADLDVLAGDALEEQLRRGFADLVCEVEVLELRLPRAAAPAEREGPGLRDPPTEGLDLDLVLVFRVLRFALDAIELQERINCHRLPLLIQEREQDFGFAVPAQPVCVLPCEVAAAGAGVFPRAADDRVVALASAADADTDDRSAGQRERVDLERACAFAGDVERRVDADVLREELTHRVTLAVDELAVDRVALALGRKLSVLRVDVPSTAEESHRRRARRRWTSRA